MQASARGVLLRNAVTLAIVVLVLAATPFPQLSIVAAQEPIEKGVGRVFYLYYPKPDILTHLLAYAVEDNTKVSVYDITKLPAKLVKEGTINRPALKAEGLAEGKDYFFYQTDKEVYLKVISDKPITVRVRSSVAGGYLATGIVEGATYVPSIDESFVGRSFLLEAAYQAPPIGGGITLSNYTIYAVEDGLVTVTNQTVEVASFSITAGSYAEPIMLVPGGIYSITSTGRIMVARWGAEKFSVVPSTTGSFVGRRFYGWVAYWRFVPPPSEYSPTDWAVLGGIGAFAVFAYEPSNVRVYEMATGQLIYEKQLSAGEYWYESAVTTRPRPTTPFRATPPSAVPDLGPGPPKHLRFESTGDIAVWSGDGDATIDKFSMIDVPGQTNVGADIAFVGGREGREFWVYVPRKAVIFAPENVEVNVNGTARSLKADEYLSLSQGFYHVTSDKPVLIEVKAGSYVSGGKYLMTYAGIPVKAPAVEEAIPLWLFGIAAVVVAAVVAVYFVKVRKSTR